MVMVRTDPAISLRTNFEGKMLSLRIHWESGRHGIILWAAGDDWVLWEEIDSG